MNWTALVFLFFMLADLFPAALWDMSLLVTHQQIATSRGMHFLIYRVPREICKLLTVACLIKAL